MSLHITTSTTVILNKPEKENTFIYICITNKGRDLIKQTVND